MEKDDLKIRLDMLPGQKELYIRDKQGKVVPVQIPEEFFDIEGWENLEWEKWFNEQTPGKPIIAPPASAGVHIPINALPVIGKSGQFEEPVALLRRVRETLQKYFIPPIGRAGIIASTVHSAEEITSAGPKSALSRIEFLINQIVKIYPQAAYAYDVMMEIEKIKEKGARAGKSKKAIEKDIEDLHFTNQELADVQILKKHPELIAQIKDTIVGYPTAQEFIAEKMHEACNKLGHLFPRGNKIRQYDNKEKEALLYGLIGAKLFLKYDDLDPRYNSPLVGMRGSALMTDPHLKKGFQALTRGILRSIKDGYTNNSFFFVFLRTANELKTQLEDLEKLCQEEGVWPEEIGTMIEVPSNVWIIDDILDIAKRFCKKHPQVKFFISFGTNDLTHTTGRNSREDKLSGEVEILDPDLLKIQQTKEGGYVFGPDKIVLAKELKSEFADKATVLRDALVKAGLINDQDELQAKFSADYTFDNFQQDVALPRARGNKAVLKKLFNILLAMKNGRPWKIKINDEGAPVILAMIEHIAARCRAMSSPDFPVSVSLCGQAVTISINRGNFGVAQKLISFLHSFGTSTNNYVTAMMLDYDVSCSLKKIKRQELKNKKALASLENISGQGVSSGRIVYIDKPEDITNIRQGLSGKIVVIRGALGSQKNLEEAQIDWDYLYYARAILLAPGLNLENSEILKDKQIKQRIKGVFKPNQEIAKGELVTVDYQNGEIYQGRIKTITLKPKLQEIDMPPAKDAAKYEKKVNFKPARKEFSADVAIRLGIHPLAFILYDQEQRQAHNGNGQTHHNSIISPALADRIRDLLGGSSVDEFLENALYHHMVDAAEEAVDQPAVHFAFDLTRNRLRMLAGGESIEKARGIEGPNFDDADYRLHGGARNLNDFWRFFDIEIRAYIRAKAEHPNLCLQLSTMGTRSCEILKLQLMKLQAKGIDVTKEQIGLSITTEADIYHLQDYIDMGIKFFSYNTDELAESLMAVNFDHPDLYWYTMPDNINSTMARPKAFIMKVLAQAAKDGVWFFYHSHRPDMP